MYILVFIFFFITSVFLRLLNTLSKKHKYQMIATTLREEAFDVPKKAVKGQDS